MPSHTEGPTPVKVVGITVPFSIALAITLTFTLAGLLVGAVLRVA